MSEKRATIAFDADDTLWHNERYFQISQERFHDLLAPYSDPDNLSERLLASERRNVGRYGYGIKGFTLSMIETAIEVTDENVPAQVIRELIAVGQDMLAHPIDLLPGVAEVLGTLTETHRLMVITKGDLLDQERKIAQSGLGDVFDAVEIVSEKTPESYARIFHAHGIAPDAAMMVGNSMKSDVLPVLKIGGWGVHVPHDLTWALEHAEKPDSHARFREIPSLSDLPSLISSLSF
jgi:putative hydrolase of the HAD superfamily